MIQTIAEQQYKVTEQQTKMNELQYKDGMIEQQYKDT